jgi:hypothetical protein
MDNSSNHSGWGALKELAKKPKESEAMIIKVLLAALTASAGAGASMLISHDRDIAVLSAQKQEDKEKYNRILNSIEKLDATVTRLSVRLGEK